MEHINNTSEAIGEHELHTFYTYAVLPQFGIENTDIRWEAGEILIPGDEAIHRFSTYESSYALMFEDCGGIGLSESFVRDAILSGDQRFEFVPPLSSTESSPSYDGFHLPVPSKYCPNITGSYTLIRLLANG